MSKLDSALASAVARWVVGFVRFRLSLNHSLNDIDKALTKAIDRGELQDFIDTFENSTRVNEKNRKIREELARELEERRKYERL